ncbi:MAG: polysaccharide deacetylase family protein [Cyanobacteria bacterium P01_F01_bin.42]
MAAADLIPYLYRFLRRRQPDCLWEGDRTLPQVALTFDDGPHPIYTPPLLRVLEQYSVKATFFWLGSWVERYPEIARAVYEQGHWIGLHGHVHRPFIGQSPTSIHTSLKHTQEAISRACDRPAAAFVDVRPPYGICSSRTVKRLRSWGYRPVMWSMVPVDWTEPGIALITQRVLNATVSGDIIVLHDGSSGGKDVANVTAAILPKLQADDLAFITVEQMWTQSFSIHQIPSQNAKNR